MKTLLTVIVVLFTNQIGFSQFGRSNNIHSAQTHTFESEIRTVLPLLQMANEQMKLFDFEQTIEILDNAVAQNPNSPEALLARARFKKSVGMESEAIEDLNIANQINPYIANLYGYNGSKGLMKLIAYEPELAVQRFSANGKFNYYYQEIDRQFSSGNYEIEKFKKLESALEALEQEKLLQAMSEIEGILTIYPQSAISYDLKGLIYKKQGKPKKAEAAFKKAVSIEPQFAIGWYNLGQIERELKNYNESKEYLDKAINLQSDLTKAYFERALLLKEMGHKKSALLDYNSIVEMTGSNYREAFLNRGLTKIMLGDFAGALADLNKAIEDYPRNPELRKNRGNLYLLYGLHKLAVEDFTKAIELDQDYAEAYYNRGLTFILMFDKVSGSADIAKSASLGYEKAIEVKPYFLSN